MNESAGQQTWCLCDEFFFFSYTHNIEIPHFSFFLSLSLHESCSQYFYPTFSGAPPLNAFLFLTHTCSPDVWYVPSDYWTVFLQRKERKKKTLRIKNKNEKYSINQNIIRVFGKKNLTDKCYFYFLLGEINFFSFFAQISKFKFKS